MAALLAMATAGLGCSVELDTDRPFACDSEADCTDGYVCAPVPDAPKHQCVRPDAARADASEDASPDLGGCRDLLECAAHRIFLTGATDGGFGGLSGADELCQAAAPSQPFGVQGGVKAILWTAGQRASQRVAIIGGVVNARGDVVAPDGATLWADGPQHAVAVGVDGAVPVWTGTHDDLGGSSSTCARSGEPWTDASANSIGIIGDANAVGMHWVEAAGDFTSLCSSSAALYCIDGQ